MSCIMNKCQHQLVCYGLYPSSECFCYFLKQEEENKMSVCMSYVGIIFRTRLIALFSCSFLFIVSLQRIKYCNAQECFSSKDMKKWPTDANFQQRIFSLSCGAEFRSHSQSKKVHFFPNSAIFFPQLHNYKKKWHRTSYSTFLSLYTK